MSWNVTIPVTKADVFDSVVDVAEPQLFGVALKDEVAEQLVAAREAAKALFHSGAIGVPEYVTGSMTGHANDNHVPAVGSANDTVTVTVTYAMPPTPIETKLAEQQPVEQQPVAQAPGAEQVTV